MIQIEIDKEVYEFMEKNARPFVDTPNTVLRRLLGFDNRTRSQITEERPFRSEPVSELHTMQRNRNEFISTVLAKEFGERFRKKAQYQFMFESSNVLIYFQNFNKESATLWYRINEKPFNMLRETNKKSFICLTNPAEGIAYLIPIEAIERQITLSKWEKKYLEINIDNVSRKWKELDWDIEQFMKEYQ